MLISLKDNQYSPVGWSAEWGDETCSDGAKKSLLRLDGVSLSELLSKDLAGGRFLVFPSNEAKADLEDKDFVYSMTDKDTDKPSFKTGNVMGFFSVGENVRIHITSRFDNNDKDFFLHYMLQKVCNVAYTPRTDSGEDEFYDFLYQLFPYYLNQALAQGLYRAYVTREYNDSNVRGPIDINRHIRYNIPFNGKIAYHTREYTTDNSITQLIRHTIEHIRSLQQGKIVLENGVDKDLRDNIMAIEMATPTYSRNSRLNIIRKNARPVSHPYYTAYEPLRKLCLAILSNQKLSYGVNTEDQIAGILFDGASLWEEYLNTVIGSTLIHSNNRTHDNGIHLFDKGGVYYPDFYRKGDNSVVVDAKYKRLLKNDLNENFDGNTNFKPSIERGDLFQMLAYIHALKARRAILVFPHENATDGGDEVLESSHKVALGYGGEIYALGVPIPTNALSYDKFAERMGAIEMSLANFINGI